MKPAISTDCQVLTNQLRFDYVDCGSADVGKASVSISSPFWMAREKVDQQQWRDVFGSNPSAERSNRSCPVDSISWYEAVAYCNEINRTFDSGLGVSWSLQLPTLGQWLLWMQRQDVPPTRKVMSEWCLDRAGDFKSGETVDDYLEGTPGTAWITEGSKDFAGSWQTSYAPHHHRASTIGFRVCISSITSYW